jgi:hypothetical protein
VGEGPIVKVEQGDPTPHEDVEERLVLDVRRLGVRPQNL